jgi:hypothetical protein
LKTSQLDINVFALNEQAEEALDEQFYYDLNQNENDSGKGISLPNR